MIITIEGVDRAGKASQSARLAAALDDMGIAVRQFDFPDYDTAIGGEIRELLHTPKPDRKKLHRLLAANRAERLGDIVSALDKKCVLVMNRYCESNMIYGLANGFSRDWLLGLDKSMPKSDMIILLDISPGESFRRKGHRDVFEADREFMDVVVRTYRDESRCGNWITIDGERDMDTVHADVLSRTAQFLDSHDKP